MRPALRRTVALPVAASFFVLGSCGDDVSVVAPPPPPSIKAVSVAPASASLRIGESLVMVAVVSADSGADRSVSWSSADPRRVSVTANGIATGVSEGVAVVTATSRANGSVQGTATIAVLPAPTVKQLAIVPASLSLRVGQTAPLVPVIVADSGADRTILWSSADPSRVSVSSSGVITGIAEGIAVITATSRARPDITASSSVNVVPAAGVRAVAVTPQTLDLTIGQQLAIAVTVDADPGIARTVSFTSTDPSIATVSPSGVVSGVASGSTTIRVAATADPGVFATVVASVRPPDPPKVSIQSITQGGTTLPVNLNGAGGQLEVAMNVESGGQPLQRLELVVSQNGRDTVVASQVYAASLQREVPADRLTLTALSQMSGDAAAHAAALSASAAAVPSTVVLSFQSAMYDPATGAVAFKNGAATLRAVLRSTGTGSVPGTTATNSVALSLLNRDGFHVTMRALSSTDTAQATDAAGLRWVQAGRGLEVTTVPVLYSDRGVGTRVIAFPGNAPAGSRLSTKSGVAVDTVLLPNYTTANSGAPYLSGETPSLTATDAAGNPLILVGSTGTNGAGILNAGPAIIAGSALQGVRVDNAPPPAGATFTLSTATNNSNNWVNGPYEFATGLTGIAGDAGVGLRGSNTSPTAASVQATYRVTGGALTDTAVVVRGSDLQATDSHLAYAAVARYSDRLGNARTVAMTASAPVHPLTTFGVDVLAPTVRFLATPPAGQTVAASNSIFLSLASVPAFGVEAIDDRAGFGPLPVRASITRLAQPNPPGLTSGTTTCALGTLVTGACAPDTLAFEALPLGDAYRRLSVPVDNGSGVEGYYTYAASVVDQAGNSASVTPRSILFDQGTGASAPMISSISFPALMRGNQPVTFLPNATDNVELISASLLVAYPNLPTARFIGYESTAQPPARGFVAIGAPFDNVLTSPLTSGSVFTIPQFIRALEIVDGADQPQPYNAATVKPDSVNAVVRDATGDLGGTAATLPTNVAILPGFVESPSVAAPGFAALTGLKQLAYWRRRVAGTLQFEAVGPSGQTQSPFARVVLLQLVTSANCAGCGVAPNSTYWRIVSELTAPVGLDNGIERLWRYDFGSRTSGQSYVAVGVSADGDAIASRVVVP
jgi:uncharacterized protein YjdB